MDISGGGGGFKTRPPERKKRIYYFFNLFKKIFFNLKPASFRMVDLTGLLTPPPPPPPTPNFFLCTGGLWAH